MELYFQFWNEEKKEWENARAYAILNNGITQQDIIDLVRGAKVPTRIFNNYQTVVLEGGLGEITFLKEGKWI